MDQSDKNVKRIDTWRLSAIVNELTAECDSFDPEIARELFDSLPEEKSSRVQVSLTSTTTTPTAQGETNAGPASFEETEEKNFRFGYSKGTYAGKWRVTKEADSVTIEPKLHNDDKEFYKLIFEKSGNIKFMISHYYTISFGITLSFVRMKPWKTMRTSEVLL